MARRLLCPTRYSDLVRLAAVGLALLAAAPAAGITFSLQLDGAQEVGAGDPTGSGSGTLSLDPVTDTISWNVDYMNLTATLGGAYPTYLSGWHIHTGVAGVNGGIVVNMGAAMSPALDTLFPISGTLTGSTSASGSLIDAIIADPTSYYVNLHTSDGIGGGFPMGAIRGQVPEPGTAWLAGLGLLALGIERRRARRRQAWNEEAPPRSRGSIRDRGV